MDDLEQRLLPREARSTRYKASSIIELETSIDPRKFIRCLGKPVSLSSMLETEVFYYKEVDGEEAKDAVLVQGLPGVGLVAKAAVAYLLDKTKNVRICRFISPDFQSIASIRDGLIVNSFADLFLAKTRRPLLLLYGNAQPSTSFGQHEFSDKLMGVCANLGCSFVLTLGGYGRQITAEERKLYCSSTRDEVLKRYLPKINGSVFSGQIIGVAGILLTEAARRNIDNLSVLAETFGAVPDFEGARKAVEAVVKLADLDLEVGPSEEISRSYSNALSRHELSSGL